jgi:hypothetical protein
MNVFGGPEAAEFVFPANTVHLAATAGTGARWFPIRHWGVRGDYRYVRVANDYVPPGGGTISRGAHRLYGALITTF